MATSRKSRSASTKPSTEPLTASTESERYSDEDITEFYAPPTNEKDAWIEYQKLFDNCLRGGLLVLKDRIGKKMLAREKEPFMTSMREGQPHPLPNLAKILSVFKALDL